MFVYSSEDLDFGGSMVSGLEVWDLGKAYYRGLEGSFIGAPLTRVYKDYYKGYQKDLV